VPSRVANPKGRGAVVESGSLGRGRYGCRGGIYACTSLKPGFGLGEIGYVLGLALDSVPALYTQVIWYGRTYTTRGSVN